MINIGSIRLNAKYLGVNLLNTAYQPAHYCSKDISTSMKDGGNVVRLSQNRQNLADAGIDSGKAGEFKDFSLP